MWNSVLFSYKNLAICMTKSRLENQILFEASNPTHSNNAMLRLQVMFWLSLWCLTMDVDVVGRPVSYDFPCFTCNTVFKFSMRTQSALKCELVLLSFSGHVEGTASTSDLCFFPVLSFNNSFIRANRVQRLIPF